MKILVMIVIAYLLGSIPTGLWIGKFFYHVNLREHGSGNTGTTNTFRVLGVKAGIVTFVIDMLKGLWQHSFLLSLALMVCHLFLLVYLPLLVIPSRYLHSLKVVRQLRQVLVFFLDMHRYFFFSLPLSLSSPFTSIA